MVLRLFLAPEAQQVDSEPGVSHLLSQVPRFGDVLAVVHTASSILCTPCQLPLALWHCMNGQLDLKAPVE